MSQKDYYKLVSEAKKIIKKIKKTPDYNLSGSTWRDYTSAKEEQKYVKTEERRKECINMLYNTLGLIKVSGYSEDIILASFNPDELEFVQPLLKPDENSSVKNR